MDDQTRKYRQVQFVRVSTLYQEYKPKIKIIKPDGETNWISITEAELAAICVLLLTR